MDNGFPLTKLIIERACVCNAGTGCSLILAICYEGDRPHFYRILSGNVLTGALCKSNCALHIYQFTSATLLKIIFIQQKSSEYTGQYHLEKQYKSG